MRSIVVAEGVDGKVPVRVDRDPAGGASHPPHEIVPFSVNGGVRGAGR
jgi:hypothetical protein